MNLPCLFEQKVTKMHICGVLKFPLPPFSYGNKAFRDSEIQWCEYLFSKFAVLEKWAWQMSSCKFKFLKNKSISTSKMAKFANMDI